MIIYTLQDFVTITKEWNQRSLSIGFTSGCFDLLHPLHVEYLNKCKKECDKLFVFIDSDELIRISKNKYPLINELDRAYMVDNLRSTSGTYIFNSVEEMEILLLNAVSDKNKIFKHNSTVYGASVIEIPNVPNIIIPDIIRFQSTTEIIKHLKDEKDS